MTARSDGAPDTTGPTGDRSDRVSLDVPADVAYVGVVRSLAAGLGARCSLTVDEIDDLRIAVDEAFALLVTLAVPGSRLQVAVDVAPTALTLAVDVTAGERANLDRNGFGWTVLEALADIPEVRDEGSTFGITLVKRAEEAVGAALSTESSPL